MEANTALGSRSLHIAGPLLLLDAWFSILGEDCIFPGDMATVVIVVATLDMSFLFIVVHQGGFVIRI